MRKCAKSPKKNPTCRRKDEPLPKRPVTLCNGGRRGAALRAAGGRTSRSRWETGAVPGAGRRLPAFSPLRPAWAPCSALLAPPGPRVQPARQPQSASARAVPAAIAPCAAAAAAASGRCGAAAEPIKAAGQGVACPCVCPCVRDCRSACPACLRDAGAQRRPPPASPAWGPAAAAGARRHVGGRCPRLQRSRRRLAEPGGVLGRGRRQPAAGTRRAGGRGAEAAGSLPCAGPRGWCCGAESGLAPGMAAGERARSGRAGGQRWLQGPRREHTPPCAGGRGYGPSRGGGQRSERGWSGHWSR